MLPEVVLLCHTQLRNLQTIKILQLMNLSFPITPYIYNRKTRTTFKWNIAKQTKYAYSMNKVRLKAKHHFVRIMCFLKKQDKFFSFAILCLLNMRKFIWIDKTLIYFCFTFLHRKNRTLKPNTIDKYKIKCTAPSMQSRCKVSASAKRQNPGF